ncbi:hypothetical protein ECB98_22605 [Brucellaceae bacterium VT-16-1752]|nr:hypothetical protein ECB98_22605 [Brucellaceae bacterium VT-16-1752]
MRFVWLDFVRWLLALSVAASHLTGFQVIEKAYLAVDFFFVLSGFVLTGAYQQRVGKPRFLRAEPKIKLSDFRSL